MVLLSDFIESISEYEYCESCGWQGTADELTVARQSRSGYPSQWGCPKCEEPVKRLQALAVFVN